MRAAGTDWSSHGPHNATTHRGDHFIVEAKEKRTPGIYGSAGAYTQAYGLFVMAFAAGCLVGPIWSGFVIGVAGWDTMVWTIAILSFAGAVPILIYTGGFILDKNAKSGEERAEGATRKKKDLRGQESTEQEVKIAPEVV